MTLEQFLTALEGDQVLISISDVDNENIIKFYSGTTAIDAALEQRIVKRIKIVSSTDIRVLLDKAE